MGNELTDGERLIQLETEVRTIKDVVLRLEKKLDMREENSVSKELLEEKLRLRDEKIAAQRKEISELRQEIQDNKTTNKHVIPMWVTAGIAALSLIISLWPHVGGH